MRLSLFVGLMLAGGFVVGPSTASAQFGSTTGGLGSTGTRPGSTGSTGSTGLGNASFGQTGTVLGAADFGGAGSGNLLRAATLQGMMGMNSGGMMGMNSFGMGGMGRMGMGGMGMGGMGGMNGMGGGQSAAPALKIPIRLGFQPRSAPISTTPVRAAGFERRLTKLPGVQAGSDVRVEVLAGVAVIRGSVPTDRDRELIEQLALLEPGIDKVENELTIAPPAIDPPASNSGSEETLPPPRG